jgi:hypothetical protein
MYEHITTPSLPGVPTAEKIGKTLAIVTAAAAGIHLTASAIRKATHKSAPSNPKPDRPQET